MFKCSETGASDLSPTGLPSLSDILSIWIEMDGSWGTCECEAEDG